MRLLPPTTTVMAIVASSAVLSAPVAHSDSGNDNDTVIPNNKRLNDGVVANVYTVEHQAGCTNDIKIDPQLRLAAQWHTNDVVNNRNLDGDIGSDGSTPQDRANAAGFHGPATETVAINQSLAISGNDLINRWYHDPAYFAIMSNCANNRIGVWSENRFDRTVVVAVYGQSPQPSDTAQSTASRHLGDRADNLPIDPTPDYDASDELEFGLNWLPWILRGVYPPPANPPQ